MKKIFLVAGGTGGHINAALALGEIYSQNHYDVLYLTGTRPLDYKLFNGQNKKHLNNTHLRSKNPIFIIRSIYLILKTIASMINLIKKEDPSALIGCGGYVCGPVLLSAFLLRKPIYIIEQNAIAGLTNRLLGYFAKIIFTHFKETKGLERFKKKVMVVGNPVRSQIKPSTIKVSDSFKILIFGGSLGAKGINEAVWKIIPQLDKKIIIHHQVGLGNNENNKLAKDPNYSVLEYIDDIQAEYDWCDMIICRAGASTISELRIIAKPCLLIPYPYATDNHQEVNAINLKNESQFKVDIILEADLLSNPKRLVDKIDDYRSNRYPMGISTVNESVRKIIQAINNDKA